MIGSAPRRRRGTVSSFDNGSPASRDQQHDGETSEVEPLEEELRRHTPKLVQNRQGRGEWHEAGWPGGPMRVFMARLNSRVVNDLSPKGCPTEGSEMIQVLQWWSSQFADRRDQTEQFLLSRSLTSFPLGGFCANGWEQGFSIP